MIKVLTKRIKTPCYCCSPIGGIPRQRRQCKVCKGTGRYTEKHYIMIIGKTAWDMDTIK